MTKILPLLLICFAAAEPSWFNRYSDPTVLSHSGGVIAFNVDSAKSVELIQKAWFQSGKLVNVDYDSLLLFNTMKHPYKYPLLEQSNLHSFTYIGQPLSVVYTKIEGIDYAQKDTSRAGRIHSHKGVTFLQGIFHKSKTTGYLLNLGVGDSLGLPIFKSDLGFGSDTIRQVWAHRVASSWEPELPGHSEGAVTMYGKFVITTDQSGTFSSPFKNYRGIPFIRTRMECSIDSVVTWQQNDTGEIVGTPVGKNDENYIFFALKFQKIRYVYYNPNVGVFMEIIQMVDVPEYTWKVELFILNEGL